MHSKMSFISMCCCSISLSSCLMVWEIPLMFLSTAKLRGSLWKSSKISLVAVLLVIIRTKLVTLMRSKASAMSKQPTNS